jgi:hypothetical protein
VEAEDFEAENLLEQDETETIERGFIEYYDYDCLKC